MTQRFAAVVRQALTDDIGERAQDGPILLCLARREGGALGPLGAAFEIHIDAVLLGVGGAGQNNVGMVCTGIAMRALIDNKRIGEAVHIELVGAEQINEIDIALARAVENAGHVAAAVARQEAEI